MGKEFIQLTFSTAEPVMSEVLIALLSDIGYSGFEESDVALKAFIDKDHFNEAEVKRALAGLAVEYNCAEIEEQNWNAQWESSFDPIIIGNFAAIRAGFHSPVQQVSHEIIITPKMSFGTGHHATTHMMVEQMADIDFTGKTVIDFGTGTGVLAILAEKLGAGSVDAIDNDDWSIENSEENTAANGCRQVHVFKADQLPGNKTYQVILANINLNVIVDSLPSLARASARGTVVLLSGFLKEDESGLLQRIMSLNFKHLDTRQNGEWICMKLEMN